MPVIKSEDTALWWKVLRNGYTAFGLDENLVKYRRPGKSLSSNKLEAVRRIWNLYRKLPVVHCVEGTPGWEIVGALKPYAGKVIDKPSFGSTPWVRPSR